MGGVDFLGEVVQRSIACGFDVDPETAQSMHE
jgi:hypothetical protein